MSRAAFRCALLVALLGALFVARPCAADVERFAIIAGNNQGSSDEQELRYATSDAKRVYDVLHELGGFAPVNMVLLENASAEELRRTVIAVNDRVRSTLSLPGRQAMLFVYYSGHGDSDALHLGASRLPVPELYQLVRGSAAQFRLLVLDACQSGALTRRKGGRVTAPFVIPEQETFTGEGVALLTASSAQEDSQESDELRASFFTQAFVSGLFGAADSDRDGAVVLEEAYRYAYEATLRGTSRTAHGLQHPTFSYDLRGQGQLVLTRPALRDAARGLLELPVGASYLVMRDGPLGAVLAEVGEHDRVRGLSLAPGPYFLRGRTRAHLLEGQVRVSAATTTYAHPDALTRIEYAHLVRKGGAVRERAHALEAGASGRTAIDNADRPCLGGFLGYRLERSKLTLSTRAGACVSGYANDLIDARVHEYELSFRIEHVWDLSARLAFALGVGPGVVLFTQEFDTRGLAPARVSLAGSATLFAASTVELGRGVYVQLDAAAQLYVLPVASDERQGALRASPALRGGLGMGRHF